MEQELAEPDGLERGDWAGVHSVKWRGCTALVNGRPSKLLWAALGVTRDFGHTAASWLRSADRHALLVARRSRPAGRALCGARSCGRIPSGCLRTSPPKFGPDIPGSIVKRSARGRSVRSQE